MRLKLLAAVAAIVLTSGIVANATPNLVLNGDFQSSSYTSNNQFGDAFGGQGVSNWTLTQGYGIYFFAGTDTTVSANTTYGGNSEKLYGPAGGDGIAGGGNFVALDGNADGVQASINQTIVGLIPGIQYQLTFDWGRGQLQSRTGATTEQVQVTFGNQTQSTAVLNNATMSFAGWVSQSFTFTAATASQVLTFLAIGTPSGGPPIVTLDNISLSQVPEPISLSLLGAGLVGLVAVRRKRRA